MNDSHEWRLVKPGIYQCRYCGLKIPAKSPAAIFAPDCPGRLDLLSPIGRGDQLAAVIDTVTLGAGKQIASGVAQFFGQESCGCVDRQKELNRQFPLVELRADQEPGTVLLRFSHGIGDRAQFTSVLRHLQQVSPQWDIDVLTFPGFGCMYEGLCRRVYERDDIFAPLEHEATYHHVRFVDFPEPVTCYADSPSTKVERVLREMFSITPLPELSGYTIRYSDEDLAAARRWCESLGGRVCVVHYHGQHATQDKNISEQVMRPIFRELRAAGLTPVVLDLHDRPRSQAVRRGEVLHLGQHHELWDGRQMPSMPRLTALGQAAERIIGIDSGPEHCWASESVSTPMLILWRNYHPLHYFPPSARITHLLPPKARNKLRGDATAQAAGREFFARHYQFIQCQGRMEREAGKRVGEWVRG